MDHQTQITEIELPIQRNSLSWEKREVKPSALRVQVSPGCRFANTLALDRQYGNYLYL